MHEYGLEMLLEIAHFWQSIAQFDPQHQRYSIEDVMGNERNQASTLSRNQ